MTEAEHKPAEWILRINNSLAGVEKPSKMSIYKVPNKLVKIKKDAYTPSIVSIGPFHRDNKELQAFNEHKRRYMLLLFMRMNKPALPILEQCAIAILDLEGDVRRCYSEFIDLDNHQLVEMLLVDGCFILELFLRHSNIDNYKDKVANPIINNARTVATLQHDLALLENQIPFFVLQKLFDIIKEHIPQPLLRSAFTEDNVATLALLFFKSALGLSDQAIRKSKSLELSGEHLLHILHNFYLPTSDESPENMHKSHLPISDNTNDDGDRQVLQTTGFKNCVTRLLEAGIQFQPNIDVAAEEIFLHIKYLKGVVKMPPLRIHEATESIFRNLIAFEQCSIATSHCIASYVFLMSSLLSSSHDAEILHHKHIIKYDLIGGRSGRDSGVHEDVVALFKSMCDGVVLKDCCFSKLCKEVNNHPRSWFDWRRLIAIVKVKCRGYAIVLPSKYFATPWTTMSLIAAVMILVFTAMQTYYTTSTYYRQY
ncbi:UPF0481 protein [Camellia lanceoleosa]|uniref:UPF0481 protein n=1 Tax=Camellia lanceoleosa TaxID=1840588 RepID=A0ACC0GB60_9ERIC|nr:UPF0481 protein [Camellia lanceoleosa]